jgi:AcrR family transcriptional regulator
MEKNLRTVRTPKQKRSIDKRNRILKASRDLFESKGFDHTDSKEIAARAGVSIGTFYSYFQSKTSLLFEIMIETKPLKASKIINDAKAKYARRRDARELITYLLKSIFELRDLPPRTFRQAISMRYIDADVEKFHKEMEEMATEVIKSILKLVEEKIPGKDLELAARMILIACKEATISYKIFRPKIKKNAFIDELADMICRYLQLSESTGSRRGPKGCGVNKT